MNVVSLHCINRELCAWHSLSFDLSASSLLLFVDILLDQLIDLVVAHAVVALNDLPTACNEFDHHPARNNLCKLFNLILAFLYKISKKICEMIMH